MKKILLIEDHKAFRNSIQITLEMEGYQVVIVENGGAALEYLEKNSKLIGLIYLFHQMPKLDSIYFLREYSKFTKYIDIPVVILTFDGHEECYVKKSQKIYSFKSELIIQNDPNHYFYKKVAQKFIGVP